MTFRSMLRKSEASQLISLLSSMKSRKNIRLRKTLRNRNQPQLKLKSQRSK